MDADAQPDPQPRPTPPPDRHELVRRRAEEIYYRNGRIQGRDAENWAQAEQEIAHELAERAAEQASHYAAAHAPRPTHRTAVVVTVNGVKYIGEYDPAASDDYYAGEFAKGNPVPVRFDGDRMFVMRPNGNELETRIVEKSQ